MKVKLECREVARLLSELQDRPGTAAETARLRLHLILCEACRNAQGQFDLIRRAMQRLGEPGAPDQGPHEPR